ncbi:hypothetical protein [Streptomyces jumonjinensis]|uniref:hypothetical protein n=1 Tax=Streptomyces jumonjinensis TaxID=1945 RepID=UPI0018865806|nr:hypothetical protein [Streptomyces jumonjinensis]
MSTPLTRRSGVAVAGLTVLLSSLPLLGPSASAAGSGVRAGEINVIADHSGRCLEVQPDPGHQGGGRGRRRHGRQPRRHEPRSRPANTACINR